MHDFCCTSPDEMYFKTLADTARYYKEDEKGVATMCKAMEDMRNETAKQAKYEAKIESAVNLIKLNKLTKEEIASSVDLPIEKVEELASLNK